ncbi:MAG: flagellar hook-associated protein FlgK, partial [Rhodospirillales bacterium]|nr:flagellar hook-associated protein FlgK [Rhodospirillales bacterium]
AMADAMNSNTTFKVTGGLPTVSMSFAERAAAIVATNSSLASTQDRNTTSQQSLTESLSHQFESLRGVNMDEELANLIVFQQAYGAAARIISTIQSMFDSLERIL